MGSRLPDPNPSSQTLRLQISGGLMADRNRQAERKNSIPAQALVCLLAVAAPCGFAWAAAPSAGFAPASYIGEFDPNLVWELLLGGIAAVSFLVAIGIWILTALRGAKSAQLR